MANNSASESRNHLSINPPHQIPKDAHGADSGIPLSPQWLLPKPGESRLGMGTGENRSLSAHANPAAGKGVGNGEGLLENQKKKDVFRPSLLDMETGRRDRWRDEERDIQPPVRKDRWRDGDKDLSETRRMDRWAENLSSRHTGEARRGPSERWSDSGNRDSSYDHRRESKWNTRWGPDDKDTDNSREKLIDSGKDGDTPLDKGLSNLTIHGKDEKDGESYRSWRTNPSQSRRKGEPTHQQTPNKQGSTFSYGRGRGETATQSTLSSGRGRGFSTGNTAGGTFSHYQTHENVFDSGDNGSGEGLPFRYSRIKLLDLYRRIDMGARNILDGFVTVQSLTQDDPVEPLALCAPSPEEMAVLRGIDKGDIASSGAPQISKDGSIGRNSMDFNQTRRSRIGSREDLPHADDFRDESAITLKDVHASSAEGLPNEKNRGYNDNKFKIEEQSHTVPREEKDIVNCSRSRTTVIGWSQTQKDATNFQENNFSNLLNIEDETRWKSTDSPMIKRQFSGVLDKETEHRKLSQPAPEDMLLFYKDPQGEVQGPFSGIDIIGWFEAGYFGIDLLVRPVDAPRDFPFSSLGDVMPHLRAKARPPPGFSVPKQGESVDLSGRPASNSFGTAHPGVNEIEMLRSELMFKQGSSTEAQNRFLESLMSGSMNSPPQGPHGYAGNNSALPQSGGENASDIYRLSQRLNIDKQRSLPNNYPYWHGRDVASMIPKSEIIPETSVQRTNLIPPMMDNSVQSQSHSADLMGILQAGLGGRSDSGIDNGAGGWSNFPVQGGLDMMQDKIELLNSQKFSSQSSIGIQQQRLSSQISPLTSLLGQAIDTPSGILQQEKLTPPGLLQDPQLLNLVQQQYLMQLQSQAPVQPQQLSLLDKLLLLKQQQLKQEEQQQLFRQQQLLSQVLSEQQSLQRFGEATYGLAASGVPVRNAPLDPSHFDPSQDLFQVGSKISLPTTLEELPAGFNSHPAQVAPDVILRGSSVPFSTAALHKLPHQIFDSTSINQNEGRSGTVAEQIGLNQEPFVASGVGERLPSSESMKLSCQEPLIVQQPLTSEQKHFVHEEPVEDTLKTNISSPIATSSETYQQHKSTELFSAVTNASETSVDDCAKVEMVQPGTAVEREEAGDLASLTPESKGSEVKEVKKPSEKKSRKQKSAKSQSSDQAKGVSKASSVPSKKSGNEDSVDCSINAAGKSRGVSSQKAKDTKPEVPTTGSMDSQDFDSSMSASISVIDAGTGSAEVKVQSVLPSTQRAWKPAPGFKPKSLLEIQQEEQMKSKTDSTTIEISSSVSSASLPTPWAGIVGSTETKTVADKRVEGASHLNMPKPLVPENVNVKKSQLHDLLAEEVLAKSSDRESENSESILPLLSTQQMEPTDDDNFIDAKETKKSRKKSRKTKSAATKAAVPLCPDVSLGTSPVDKGKSARVVQQEKEVLPAIPSGPSLGDFVPWKGEPVNPSPAPAWSSDSKKVPRPTSLREILKEQEKNTSFGQPQNQIPTQKLQQVEATHNGAPLRSIPASPSKAASPIQINSQASVQAKFKADDDLFWGPVDQAKQDAKQANFPVLANVGGRGSKSTPVKGNASLSRQKSTGSRLIERVLSSSPSSAQSTVKGRKDNMVKQSEAMDFRDWCENECARLIGSTDTSFLEFCLKQSRSEAELLLVENLGSFDPNHEFIEKFLNYKDLLPADVLDIAFHTTRSDRKASGFGATEMKSENIGAGESDSVGVDAALKGGASKKKGKKGKKVSPSVLGFNVVSNRIMMGEIQSVED